MIVDRTHASPSHPVTPRSGVPHAGARAIGPPETGSAEELLRAWALAEAADAEEAADPADPAPAAPAGPLRRVRVRLGGRPAPRVLGVRRVLDLRRTTGFGRALGQRPLVGAVLVLLAVLGVAVGAGYLITEDIGDNVKRVPGVFGALDPSGRPAPNPSLTFLLVGTDSRSPEPTTGSDAPPGVDPGSQRSDVLMIARLNPDRTAAAVASIPRDAYVDIPGHGRDKINAAYAFGGPALLVKTVENLTGIRIDHFAVIDFAGFKAMVDAVGGIDVGIDAPTVNDGVAFHQGVNHLDGRAALAYVRQRYGLLDGDLDRAQREQNALRALVAQVATHGTLSDPAGTYDLLDAASRSVSVDDTLSNGGLRSLASTLHGLQATDLTFVRAPIGDFGRERSESVVYLAPQRSAELWAALREDRVAQYADAHPGDALGPVTR